MITQDTNLENQRPNPDLAGINSSSENLWSIEFLRGVAALLVVVAHYHGLTEMDFSIFRFSFTGVDLFLC